MARWETGQLLANPDAYVHASLSLSRLFLRRGTRVCCCSQLGPRFPRSVLPRLLFSLLPLFPRSANIIPRFARANLPSVSRRTTIIRDISGFILENVIFLRDEFVKDSRKRDRNSILIGSVYYTDTRDNIWMILNASI